MAQSNQRLVLDLDDIERQLREAQQSPPAKNDPLAELARIVGQNDPFRTLIAGEKPARPEPLDREDLFVDPPLPPGHELAVSRSDRAAPHAGMADRAYAADDEGAYPEPGPEFQPLERRRSRKGLITVGVVLGTAVLAVAGALVLRKPSFTMASGEPPVVAASKEPLKVQPENPGGVDIPNQNAQVYERGSQDKQTRVVDREEQPIDVQQAARAAQAPSPQSAGVVPPSTATPGNVPAAPRPQVSPNSAVASLGEPKRVRTVSVRPDGTIVSLDQPSGASALSAVPAAPPRAAVSAPAASPAMTGATTPAPQATPLPQRPRTEERATPPAATLPPAQATAPRPPAPAVPSGPLPIAPSAGQPPQQTAPRTTAAVPATPKATETTSAAGGFSVQLSVMPSEEQARKQAQALRQKYAGQLGGRAPQIQTAEINGKTLYRIRIGPMSQDDANNLCTRLKAAQGACFVAKN